MVLLYPQINQHYLIPPTNPWFHWIPIILYIPMEYPHYIPFDQNFSCLPLANQQFLMENHNFSSIFMHRKRYQTVRGKISVYRYIRISYPHFSCWTPHSSRQNGSEIRCIRHPKTHHFFGSSGSWTSCGSSRASALRTGASGFLAVRLILVGSDARERKWWCFWGAFFKMMFLCFVCFVDWRYWRWILKRFNNWHPLT